MIFPMALVGGGSDGATFERAGQVEDVGSYWVLLKFGRDELWSGIICGVCVCLLSWSIFRNPLATFVQSLLLLALQCIYRSCLLWTSGLWTVENHILSAGGFLIYRPANLRQVYKCWLECSMSVQVVVLPGSPMAEQGACLSRTRTAIISTLCIFLKKSSSCLWCAIWLASGQCLQVSVVTFSQFGQRISSCADLGLLISFKQNWALKGCWDEVNKLPDWKHALFALSENHRWLFMGRCMGTHLLDMGGNITRRFWAACPGSFHISDADFPFLLRLNWRLLYFLSFQISCS